MEKVWILVFTVSYGDINLPEYQYQITVPHQYKSEENCKKTGLEVIRTDIDKEYGVFKHRPFRPRGNAYQQQNGSDYDCFGALIDGQR